MAFPPAFLEELAARNPIEDVVGQYVSLSRKGGNLFGLCPFHSEKTGSFSVAPEKGIYYCFGCHKGGGVVNFVMEIENLDYPEAVRFLAKRAGMEVPEDETYRAAYRRTERLLALSKEAARFFREQLLSPAGEQARTYIAGRGLTAQSVTRFGLGFAPNEWSSLLDAMQKKGYKKEELLDAGLAVKGKKGGIYDRFRNRLMFPIIDVRGNVIGFGGRVMDNSEPKYLNSPETAIFNKRKNLFALNFARKSKLDRIILVEGYMDVISLHQHGFDCAVASLGTALTEEHANILAKYTKQVVLTYDGDEAGQNATRRAIPMLEKAGLMVKVLRMQGAKDPDEFVKKYGADRFSLLLDKSENQAEYRLESLKRKFDLTQDDQRVAFLKEAAVLISSLSTAVEREVYGHRAAEAAGVSYDAVRLEAEKAFKHRMARERKRQEAADLAPAKRQQPHVKGIYYENLRSAMAEEGVLQILVKEPSLFASVKLTAEQFSSPLLGKAYAWLKNRWHDGQPVTLAGADETFTKDEMSHLSRIVQKDIGPIRDDALQDYLSLIRQEYARAHASGEEDLLALAARMKEKKSYGG